MSSIPLLPVIPGQPIVDDAPQALTLEAIERDMQAFEAAERRKLGLVDEPLRQWRDPNPQEFRRCDRSSTTILTGGLTLAHDVLIQQALSALGYRIEILDCPDTAALHLGKEYGNRGQCNPTWFTVGNLLKRLRDLRQTMSAEELNQRYVFLTAGACGPCRFGTYATEYRKALRDAGFEGFRVLLFQQQGGLKQASGAEAGLEFTPRFFRQLIKAIVAGDVLNAMGYRIRPYEVQRGQTDAVLTRCRTILGDAFLQRRSIVRAMWRCRRELQSIRVDRLQPKPRVMIIGEFWAMTTEGDGNYHLQRFLEAEGAEVDIQLVTYWLLYMLWQNGHDTRRRLELNGQDTARRGLAGRNPRQSLRSLWLGERVLRSLFHTYAWAIGLKECHLPDMQQIADLAHQHYHVELRGGEGHMEVGKLIDAVTNRRAHMVISVKPFGCMPSSGVSDGVQQIVLSRYPDAVFCAVETSGDGEVNFQSRVLMSLFRARRRAREEFEQLLLTSRRTVADARELLTDAQRCATWYPPQIHAGTASSTLATLR